MIPEPRHEISLLGLGRISPDSIEALGKRFAKIEQIDLGIASDGKLHEHRGEINRAIDGAASLWILILREREIVTEALASEIARVALPEPAAWGFRIRSMPLYAGRPLIIGTVSNEIRLIHKKHSRFDMKSGADEMRVQGAVVRLSEGLERVTFANTAEHVDHLATHSVPHSSLRRILLFTHAAITSGALWRSRNTLRYLWIEAGFDSGR